MKPRRFAIFSHVLPPSPSGQSVMLYRILSGFNPDDYYLVSHETYTKKAEEKMYLPVEYFSIPGPWLLNRLNHQRMPESLRDLTSIMMLIVWRTYKLVWIIRKNPVYAIIACSGDIADIPAGFLASKILGVDFYAYIFDDYVYQWTGLYRSFAKFIAPWIFKRSVAAIGPNKYICDEYSHRYGIKYVIVHNPCSAEELNAPVNELWPAENGRIRIMYTGAIYRANYDCFRNLIRAMDLLENHTVELHIYTAQSMEELSAQGIEGENVQIHSHVPYDQILEEQHRADMLFLPLAFESPIPEVLRTSAPGKMAEYLASGRPVLAHVPADSFVAYYMNMKQCGVVAGKNDSSDLARWIFRLVSDEGLRNSITANARKQARLDFDPRISRDRLNNFLSATMNRKGK
jgi:glycosyltransferase involved in cell wall biosynthesis